MIGCFSSMFHGYLFCIFIVQQILFYYSHFCVQLYSVLCRPMHEITFSTVDKPKLLSLVIAQLSCFASYSYIFLLFFYFFFLLIILLNLSHLYSQLTSILAELGLNILEAHAFSTVDGYSLDVFVVEGWPYEVPFYTSAFYF